MYSEETVLNVVDSIYAAAGDPVRWTEVLQRLAAALHGKAGTIHHQDTSSKDSSFSSLWNLEPKALVPYIEYYGALNPLLVTRPELIRTGAVNTSQMLCPDEIALRTEYYQDFLRPLDVRHCIGSALRSEGANATHISIFRPVRGEPFDEEERAFLLALVPHLQRAFQLHMRIQGLETRGNAALGALDCLQHGVILLDAKRQVLFFNKAAKALCAGEKALVLTNNGLVAGTRFETRQLNMLIQGAITTASGTGLHSGGAMIVARPGMRQPLQILVTPLRTQTINLGKGVPVVAVFISDPNRKAVSDETILRQLYALTGAEARLAGLLASGESLCDASDRLGVTKSTLRSQLKSIFAKTNTNRQSELVRLLLVLPNRLARDAQA